MPDMRTLPPSELSEHICPLLGKTVIFGEGLLRRDSATWAGACGLLAESPTLIAALAVHTQSRVCYMHDCPFM